MLVARLGRLKRPVWASRQRLNRRPLEGEEAKGRGAYEVEANGLSHSITKASGADPMASGGWEVARKCGIGLLDHATVRTAGVEAIEHTRQAPEHPLIEFLGSEEVSIAQRRMSTWRPTTQVRPSLQWKDVVKVTKIGNALREWLPTVDSQGRHASIQLDALSPSTSEFT
jgi:hypothetical protein